MSNFKNLAIAVGGGPAPGINGIISASVIEAINSGCKAYGVMDGLKRLLHSEPSCLVPLSIEDVSQIPLDGGSILRTSSDSISLDASKINALKNILLKHNIGYLLIIGGTDTLALANVLEKSLRGSINIAFVPKTINNDIPLPGGFPSVGFQTALHRGVKLVKNIIADARTTGRWYFITTMGKHAGHLALGIGKASGASLTIIPEDFHRGVSVQLIADILAGAIVKRLAMQRDYGVAVIAEGVAEKIVSEELSYVDSDFKGQLKLSEIQLGRILKSKTQEILSGFGIKMTIVDKNIGYELRASAPVTFDMEYTKNLGFGAVRYLLRDGTGAVITFYDDRIKAVPFTEIIDYKTGKVPTRLVDTNSEIYLVAQRYMIQLEKEDFEDALTLQRLSSVLNLSKEQFTERFRHVLEYKKAVCGI